MSECDADDSDGEEVPLTPNDDSASQPNQQHRRGHAHAQEASTAAKKKRERPTSGSDTSSGERAGPNSRKSIAAPWVASHNKCSELADHSDEEGDDQPQSQGIMGGPAVVP
jgi:hypothetical protein